MLDAQHSEVNVGLADGFCERLSKDFGSLSSTVEHSELRDGSASR